MNKKILLADDSLTIQKVVELTFMDEGFEVEAVGSGKEALSVFGDLEPDLVIADVHMPAPDGYGVCREVKSRSPETPVLLLVGTFQPFDQGQADSCGADGFLKKPFDSQELFRQVEELVAPGAAQEEEPQVEFLDPESAETLAAIPLDDLVPADTFAATTPVESPDLGLGPPAFEARQEEEPGETTEVAETLPAEAGAADGSAGATLALDDADIERIAQRVAEIIGQDVLREVSWEVVPDLAEIVIKDRLRDLESQLD